MSQANRFQDENLLLSDFFGEVWVVCPVCAKKAVAKTNSEFDSARMCCSYCGFNKEVSSSPNDHASLKMAAHLYFDATLWLKSAFKNETFYAYNDRHLDYLERYICATLRENKDRTHFTLLEKLPKFYHEAKNRNALLKIIAKLKSKT